MYKNYFMKTIFFVYNGYQGKNQNNIYEILSHHTETKILMNFL